MKILFMGTPAFAIPSLARLIESSDDVVGVFSQPDRPVGRSHTLTSPPVKQFALTHHLPVYSPQKIRTEEIRETIAQLALDAIVVVAYGKILPPWMLEMPRYGAINVHASLLPQYRGAAPIQWAVANGETLTGVTTIQMDAGLDTGDILLQREVAISPEENAQTLHDKLSGLGADLLMKSLEGIREGSLEPREQDHSRATLAPMLKKADGKLDWGWPADRIHNLVRGLNPWPGTFSTFRGGYLRIWKTERSPEARDVDLNSPPGTLIPRPHSALQVRTGAGTLLGLLEVQPAGHRRMSGIDFLNGFRIAAGEHLI
ncbi:MAG: methionyl-tRNA formyltransferase [Acidobacteriia bacterium]|nr:methionyl-tRNA formyltransferase [Terriglobia bacterium]